MIIDVIGELFIEFLFYCIEIPGAFICWLFKRGKTKFRDELEHHSMRNTVVGLLSGVAAAALLIWLLVLR